ADVATKVFYLNKALHGVDVYYEIELPDVFLMVHPMGTVLGRAQYGSHFVVYQGCTVGGNPPKVDYPILGEGVALMARSTVIGQSHIPDNSIISAGAFVMDEQVPPDMVIYGTHPEVRYKPIRKSVKDRFSR
ncbi:MAG: serine O-acetyltransferase, partial [Abditibacteriota bacterium]|nr:serine O-acetyltransferase [Abditibacteriota bacterium]